MKPAAGLLSQREFFNALALRVFNSTQYIRHDEKPLFSPEPDVLHEVLGHVPMLANQGFADLCHVVGLASLGASESELAALGALFWYTVEVGICTEGTARKVYGTAVMTSWDELLHSQTDVPEFLPFETRNIAANYTTYPVATVQPLYFQAQKFEDVPGLILEYVEHCLERPFNVSFDTDSHSIWIDRKIKTREAAKAIYF